MECGRHCQASNHKTFHALETASTPLFSKSNEVQADNEFDFTVEFPSRIVQIEANSAGSRCAQIFGPSVPVRRISATMKQRR